MQADQLVTLSEAGRALGVSVFTLRRWERAGLLRAKRTIGGHRRFLVADLERLARRALRKQKAADAAR